MRLRVGAATNKGLVREINEDVYMLRAAQGLFLVCDGMGGAPAGEVASQIAADTITRELAGTQDGRRIAHGDDGGYLPQTTRLADAVRLSNELIYRQGQADPRQANMGTTVVGAWVKHHIASVAHVGDSRAYLWRDGHLQPLTRDHSLGEALALDGIAESETTVPADQRDMLVRVVGGEPDVEVDLKEVPLQPGDCLLLCSDGLTRMVPESRLREALSRFRDPQQICDELVDAANRNGGADNVTVVIVEIPSAWWRRASRFFSHLRTRPLKREAASRELEAGS